MRLETQTDIDVSITKTCVITATPLGRSCCGLVWDCFHRPHCRPARGPFSTPRLLNGALLVEAGRNVVRDGSLETASLKKMVQPNS